MNRYKCRTLVEIEIPAYNTQQAENKLKSLPLFLQREGVTLTFKIDPELELMEEI